MRHYIEVMREEALTLTWMEAGAPTPMEMWAELQGVKLPDTVPLTVQQAARRLNVSHKFIRRRLATLEAMDPRGAYRVGEGARAPWRIIPAALDRLRDVETVAPKTARPPRGKPKPVAPKKRSATRWEV
jgi:hypothetical protein